MIEKISETDIIKIAFKIKNDFFKPVNSYKTTIFLCGGDINHRDTLRYLIAKIFSGDVYSRYIDVIYPEDIFDELLYHSKGKDLLSLENMLAESVDVILIIPESPGSFSELGAFANTDKLRSKIICLLDPQFKKDKSFINQGPIKLIKHVNKQNVVYTTKESLNNDLSKLSTAINKIKKTSSKKEDKIGLLHLDGFILPTIYLFGVVPKNRLIEFVAKVNVDGVSPFHATTVALTMLTKKNLVELTTDGYRLTKLGLQSFLDFRKTPQRIKTQDEIVALDNMRLEIFNLEYRKKKLKV